MNWILKTLKDYSIGIFIIIGFGIGQFYFKNEVWTGFYYPDVSTIEDQRTWIISPPIYSLNECREWVNAVHKSGDDYDYNCSQGCRFVKDYGEETVICKNKIR